MRPGKFFWKLFLGNAVLLALTLAISVWLIIVEFDRFQAAQLTPILHSQARTILQIVQQKLNNSDRVELQEVLGRIESKQPDGLRITLIAASGQVLADSQHDPATMENHGSRPEVLGALRDGVGESERWSDTISRTMKYVALRVGNAETPVGYVRVALPVRTLTQRAMAARHLLGPLGAILLASAIALAVGLAFLWSNRLRRLTSAAQRLARGDLTAVIPASGTDEVAALAKSLERMRGRLARQVGTITGQHGTLESLVSQLEEGLVVADARGRVVLINPAAARLLGFVGPANGFLAHTNYRVEQIVPHHDLQQLLLGGGSGVDGSSPVPSPGEVFENPHLGAVRLDIPDPQNPVYVLAKVCNIALASTPAGKEETVDASQFGRLLVLMDVTALMRAIRSRSDFVANASHELRTPVSAIAVAAETLLKLDMAIDHVAAAKFAEVIARHAARLDALVRDLLDLAKVESPGARFEPTTIHLQRAIDQLRGRWKDELEEKQMQWKPDVTVEASELTGSDQLLSLVLDNLVDNAIKFTPPGGRVSVRTFSKNEHVVIEVSDTGCGIPEKDQARVFERFYQVDSVRTGTGNDKRGTGLGLSIVRHAVSAMGGEISLESEEGRGTRVSVTLPRKPAGHGRS